MPRFVIVLILISVLLSACGYGTASNTPAVAPAILASTTLLADIARQVAGTRVEVGSLLPFGADAHNYQPTPADVMKIAESKVFILNGAGYETSLAPYLQNNAQGKIIISASKDISVRMNENQQDPHFWLDPTLVIIYVENIRDGLIAYDPIGADEYRINAENYIAELKKLDEWIKEQVNQIPVERRLLVTNHEALGYFAARYGFTIVGAVIESFSADASPSARQMANLIEQIKNNNAPAIFLDAADNPALAEQIASESGVKVISDLYLESLTNGAPAESYIEFMRYNVMKIVSALK